ncbi:MAG: DUF1801 domain-containing protein [Chloroflexota bacterium]
MAEIDTYVEANSSPAVQTIFKRVIAVVRDELAGTNEKFQTGYGNVVFTSGKTMASGGMVYVTPLKASVNLGFLDGVDLPDPDGLLKGTGKRLRHIKFKNSEQVDQQEAAIRALIRSQQAFIEEQSSD